MGRGQSRLGVAAKITLVAAAFSIPISVLVYLFVSTIDLNISFAAWEMKGDEYQRPLERILEGAQGHELAYRFGQQGPEGAKEVARLKKLVDDGFADLERADTKVGVDLQFTQIGLAKRGREHTTVATVLKEWKELASLSGLSAEAMAEKYDHFAGDIRTMITHAGDTSNLILDPDLDSYYLMDVTLLALPQTQDRLAKVIRYGAPLLDGQPLQPADQVKFAVYAAMLQEADHDRVVASTTTSLNEDQNFYGTLPSVQSNLKGGVAKYTAMTVPFIEMLRQASAGAVLNREAFVAAGMAARTVSFRYWDTSVTEMDALLRARIVEWEAKRTWALLLSGAALLISCIWAFLVARGIIKPLNWLAGSLGPGADLLSNTVGAIADVSKNKNATADEYRIICDELGAHASDMRGAVHKLVSLVHGGGTRAS